MTTDNVVRFPTRLRAVAPAPPIGKRPYRVAQWVVITEGEWTDARGWVYRFVHTADGECRVDVKCGGHMIKDVPLGWVELDRRGLK